MNRATRVETLGKEASDGVLSRAPLPPEVEFVELVQMERERQAAKWGTQREYDLTYWLCILAEEFGEFAKEVVELHSGRELCVHRAVKELTEVAAVAQAIYEEYLHERLHNEDSSST